MGIGGKGKSVLGQILLLSATVVWGSSFIILKETISALPALYVIAVRFLASGVLLCFIFFKKIRAINKTALLQGVILGTFLALAYIMQTTGLKHISAGKNAFITSLYCVICPFMLWLTDGVKPKSYNLISAVLCVAGVGFIVLSGAKDDGGNFYLGSALTFGGAVFFALQIIFTGKYHQKKADTVQLLTVQLLTAGLIVGACSLASELPFCVISAYAIDGDQILRIAYLTLVCTLYAQLAQMIGLKFTGANMAAVILTLEAVFAVIFSLILGKEKLTALLIVGFAVIFVGTLISELKVDFGKLFRQKSEKNNAAQGGFDKDE